VLYENYWQDGFLNLKYKGKTDRFSVRAFSNLSFRTDDNNEIKPSSNSAVKILTNLPNGRAIDAKVFNSGEIRVESNLGQLNIGGKKTNVSASVKTNSELGEFKPSIALSYEGAAIDNSVRLKFGKKGCCNKFVLGHRVLYTRSDWRMGFASKINLSKGQLSKYNAFVGVRKGNTEINLEHLSKSRTKISLGKLVLSTVYHCPKIDYAAKIAYRPFKEQNEFKPTFGISTEINPNVQLKARLDGGRYLALATTLKVTDRITVGLGTELELKRKNLHQWIGEGNFRIPMGINVEFNNL